MWEWFKERYVIDAEEAKEMGLTHEGTLYGVPAWFDRSDEALDDGMFYAVPKFVPLRYWTRFCDAIYETAAMFIPGDGDTALVSPIKVTGKIK